MWGIDEIMRQGLLHVFVDVKLLVWYQSVLLAQQISQKTLQRQVSCRNRTFVSMLNYHFSNHIVSVHYKCCCKYFGYLCNYRKQVYARHGAKAAWLSLLIDFISWMSLNTTWNTLVFLYISVRQTTIHRTSNVASLQKLKRKTKTFHDVPEIENVLSVGTGLRMQNDAFCCN